jgi:DNA-binding FadR family transcriptional regulator
MLERIQKSSLSDVVFTQIRSKIVSGEMAPGMALPSERILCEMLGVNRGAVREALKRLQQARLVSIQQGGSTRVLSWRETATLDLLSALLINEDGGLNLGVARSVIEMRSALAPDIARLAAARGGPAAAAPLEDHLERMRAAGDDLETLQVLALEFWGLLAVAGGNVAYQLAFNTLRESYSKFLPALTSVLADEFSDLDTYAAITAAVRAGDGPAARDAGQALIQRGASAISALLDALQGDV